MNKRRFLFTLPAVLALILLCASCPNPFSVPTGVTITGSPSIEVPLGSRDFYLSDVFGVQEIKDSMDDDEMAIYEHTASGLTAKTYLIHYSAPPVSVEMDVEDDFGFDMTPIEMDPVMVPFLNGLVSISVSVGQQTGSSSSISTGDTSFVEAVVKTGHISLSGLYNFSNVDVTLLSSGKEKSIQPLEPMDNPGNYNLAEKTIYNGVTQIQLTRTTTGSTITVNATPSITEFESITVKLTQEKSGNSTEVDFSTDAWLKAVNFTQTGFKVTLSPSVVGLTVKVNSSDFGIDATESFTKETSVTGEDFVGGEKQVIITDKSKYDAAITLNPSPPAGGLPVTIYTDAAHPLTPNSQVTIRATPTSLFDWNQATINPQDFFLAHPADSGGTFPGGEGGFDISDLTKSMGSATGTELQFNRITMNLYTGGNTIDEMTIKLYARYSGVPEFQLPPDTQTGTPEAAPNFSPEENEWATALPNPVYKNTKEITGVFQESPSDLKLRYEIGSTATEGLIEKVEGAAFSIKPDIVIEMPLEFLVAAEKPELGYAVINLEMAEFISGDGKDKTDAFGRSDPGAGGDKEFIDQIQSAGLKITYKNTLMNSSLYLAQYDGEVSRFTPKLIFDPTAADATEPKVTDLDLNIAEEIRWPFMPVIEVHVPLTEGANTGVLIVRPDKPDEKAGINMLSISARVKTDLDITF
jgi:hypothetical protein